METLKYWVWIMLALGPANRRVWELTVHYETITEAFDGITAGNYKGMLPAEISAFKKTHLEQAEKLIDYCTSNGISIFCYDDEVNFPSRLRDIYNPPTVLFCYGSLNFVDDSIALAVVGAREPSEYSVKVAETVCTELAKVGTVLVSGFAHGIDSIAHKSALNQKSRTIAVLGCGIDYDYPKDNAKLKKILAQNGAVVSEYPPGTRPFQEYFRQRNRLISALSLGVLIVQASSKSGSLNTASHALQQGKDIFCIPPHDIFDENYSGVISLLRDGAIPVFSHYDIMYEYYDNFSHKLNDVKPFDEFYMKSSAPVEREVVKVKQKDKKRKSVPKEKEPIVEEHKESIDTSMLSETQAEIVKLLSEGTLLADEITVRLNMSVSEVLTALTELELFGYIKALAGKRYSL